MARSDPRIKLRSKVDVVLVLLGGLYVLAAVAGGWQFARKAPRYQAVGWVCGHAFARTLGEFPSVDATDARCIMVYAPKS